MVPNPKRTSGIHRRDLVKAIGGTAVLGSVAGCGARDTPASEQDGGGGTGTTTTTSETTATEQAPDAARPGPESGTSYRKVPELKFVGISRQIDPMRFELQSLASEQFRSLGLSIDLQPGSWAPLSKAIQNDSYDLLTLWWVARPSRLDPHFMLYKDFHSSGIESGANIPHYDNQKYDQTVEKTVTTLKKEERKQHVYKCQEMIANDQPIIFQFHADALGAYNTRNYEGWEPQIGTQVFWNVDNFRSVGPTSDKDILVWGTGRKVGTLHPMTESGGNRWQQALKLIYPRLTYWNADGENELRAATDISIADNTTVDVTLRDGMQWSDGEPFTAEDVAFSVDYYQQYIVPYYKNYYKWVESTEVKSETEVRFNLNQPFAAFSTVSLSQLNILPKHVWDGVVEEKGLEHPRQWSDPDMTGAGPFKLVDFEPQRRILYEKNPDHFWASDINFEELLWRIYGSETAAFGSLEEGKVSFMQEIAPNHLRQAKSGSEQVKPMSQPAHGATAFWANNGTEPINDLMFRRALAYASDKDRIIKLILGGRATPAVTPIAPVNEFWYNPDVKTYEGGVQKAVEVLKGAGYRWDQKGNLLMPKDRFSGDGPPKYTADLE